MINKKHVKVDYSKDALFDSVGLQRLQDSYMRSDEKSPQDRFSYVARSFASNPEHAQRLYDYLSNHWLSAATPILSYGLGKRGMPISCFLSYIDDSAEGLIDTLAEACWLSILGGGVGLGLGIRSADNKSVGVMPHIKTYEAAALAYRQGKTRRGSFAMYLNIDHPDIVQFIQMRKTTGDQSQRALEMHHGVNISDKFMEVIEDCMLDEDANDDWPLIDPNSGDIKEVVSAKWLWEMMLETRFSPAGEPFMHFIDTSNRAFGYQKALGLSIKQSNICTEIIQATDKDRTAVCCLSSLNLEYFDSWSKDPQFIHDVVEMLDNALEVFIKKAPKTVKRAIFSAQRERSIGIGELGFHAYLQQHNIPWETAMALGVVHKIEKHITDCCAKAEKRLQKERGSCPDAIEVGIKKRFTHMRAIAPNATSSILMGNTSPSIAPFRANAYRQDTLSGIGFNRNKYLARVIDGLSVSQKRRDDIWSSIITSKGSCQHIPELDEWTKSVFKTASEIDQRWVVSLAAARQQYIDQSQSVNLNFLPNVEIAYLHHVHFQAWKQGLKTLYYCRMDKVYSGDALSNTQERVSFELTTGEECLACEG